jgi:hypothetical protein
MKRQPRTGSSLPAGAGDFTAAVVILRIFREPASGFAAIQAKYPSRAGLILRYFARSR